MEKLYKLVVPVGKLLTHDHQYALLSPYPVVKDSWQNDNQQRFIIALPDYERVVHIEDKILAPCDTVQIVVSDAAIILTDQLSPIALWTGEYDERPLTEMVNLDPWDYDAIDPVTLT